MGMRIWKYELKVVDMQVLHIPKGGRILSVAVQRDRVVLYAEVQPDGEPLDVTVAIFGTGHTLRGDILTYQFLGTVVLAGGDLMFHVYYKYGDHT